MMTKAKILTAILIVITTWTFGQKDFSRLTQSADSTYGYTENNPLRMKKGSLGKSIGYSYDFLHGLKTSDNQKLKFLQRTTVENPGTRPSKTALTNRYTGSRLSGDGGELDKYLFLTVGRKDTVIIFVDIYKRGDLKIPVGLKFE
jgi:hypothetical protein